MANPVTSKSRPRTKVADAIAGRIPVGMGTPAARSNSGIRRTGGTTENVFVRDVLQHGSQPSFRRVARPGGLDSAAASRQSVFTVMGEQEGGSHSETSSGETVSSSTTSGVPSSVGAASTPVTPAAVAAEKRRAKRRWRCELRMCAL